MMTNFLFFWGHHTNDPTTVGKECLSQWYPAPFKAFCPIQEHTFVFPTAEHYMMYQKAMLFGDQEIANKIIIANTPKEAKALGRQVNGFDEEVWKQNREVIVSDANVGKFTQNQKLFDYLTSLPEDTYFVEASPYDRVWGIGLRASDQRAKDPNKWQGLNLLGKCLTHLKQAIEAKR